MAFNRQSCGLSQLQWQRHPTLYLAWLVNKQSIFTKHTIKCTGNNITAANTSTSVWKPNPFVATIDIQDKDDHVVIGADVDDVTLTEEESGYFHQNTSSENKDNDERP